VLGRHSRLHRRKYVLQFVLASSLHLLVENLSCRKDVVLVENRRRHAHANLLRSFFQNRMSLPSVRIAVGSVQFRQRSRGLNHFFERAQHLKGILRL